VTPRQQLATVAVLLGALLCLAALWYVADTYIPPLFSVSKRIEQVAWTIPIPGEWLAPATDVSAQICPLVDDKIKNSTRAATEHEWVYRMAGPFGPCFSQERFLLVAIDPATESCRASLRVPPPSCSF